MSYAKTSFYLGVVLVLQVALFGQNIYADSASFKKELLEKLASDIALIKDSCIDVKSQQTNNKLTCGKIQRLLENLEFDIKNTPDDKLINALIDTLARPQRYEGKYILPLPYLDLAGEEIIPAIQENYRSMPIQSKLYAIDILSKIKSKKSLPLIISALQSNNSYESLKAQKAIINILQEKAMPYLKKCLVKSRGTEYIKETIRNIRIINPATAGDIFFKYLKENRLPARAIANIFPAPQIDCKQQINNEAQILIDKLTPQETIQLSITDIEDINGLLNLFKQNKNNWIVKEIWAHMRAQELCSILKAENALALTYKEETSLLNALNQIINDKKLFTKKPELFFKFPITNEIIRGLIKNKVYYKTSENKWDTKKALNQEEINIIRGLNFITLHLALPKIAFAFKGRVLDAKISASLLCSISERNGFLNLIPVIPDIFACAYEINNFTSDIWDKTKCLALINRLFTTLDKQDLLAIDNKINTPYKSGVDLIIQNAISQKDEGYDFYLPDYACVSKFIFDKDKSKPFIFPIQFNKETFVTSPRASFYITISLDKKNWHLNYTIKALHYQDSPLSVPMYGKISIKINNKNVEITNIDFVKLKKDEKS